MQLSYLLVNILGVAVYLGIAFLFSNNKKKVSTGVQLPLF